MKLNNLLKINKKKIRDGRGIGSGKGKTSSRGHKGQKMPLYRRLPKRGFKSINNKKIAIMNLSRIQNLLEKDLNSLKDSLDLKILKEKKLVNKKYLKLKILGKGELKKNIDITAHYASKQALEKVKKAGGKLSIIKK